MTIKPLQTAIILLGILLLAATSGCTTSPRASVVNADYQGSAEQAYARRDFQRAARIWQQKAMGARPAQALELGSALQECLSVSQAARVAARICGVSRRELYALMEQE